MYKENIFELIRKEEVVLWAGAGLSLYAGYPSGNQLTKKIYSALSEPEKKYIDENIPLSDMAEQFVRFRNGKVNSLIDLLKKIFIETKPSSTELHNKLALIPHIKTIITTNYDPLFEIAYADKIQLLTSSIDIPYIKDKKVDLFKVHGNLNQPESIIISTSDYIRFFNSEYEKIYWSVILERITTKNVVFIGYNLEDLNIMALFDRILTKLDKHSKEIFFIAPNIPEHKIKHLTLNKIHYISSTAEEFIDDLIKDIDKNIMKDFHADRISTETFNQYLNHYRLIADLKGAPGSYKVSSLRGIDGQMKGKMTLALDKEIADSFQNFISGKTLDDYEIDSNFLKEFAMNLEGLNLYEEGGVFSLKFIRHPSKTTSFDIKFKTGFELTSISLKIYNGNGLSRFIAEYKNATFQIDLAKGNSTKFYFSHGDSYNNTKDEIEIFSLLHYLASGEEFDLYCSDNKYNLAFHVDNAIDYAKWHLDYFLKLKKIEDVYNVKFKNMEKLDDDSHDNINYLITLINDKEIFLKDDKTVFSIDNVDNLVSVLDAINASNEPMVAQSMNLEQLIIYDQQINLGYKRFEVHEPFVLDYEETIKEKRRDISIKSKVQKNVIKYLPILPPQ